MAYYKFLTSEHKGEYSDYDYSEYLPKENESGAWLPTVETLSICESGYHCFEPKDILSWINAELWEVEVGGDVLKGDKKLCAQQIRFIRKIEAWNEKTARLFACWCVRQIWHLLADERSKNAVIVAEKYANGEATESELAAARAAARAAAGDDARAATWAAACAAARDDAWAATWDAAWASAGDAAWASAGDASWIATRDAAGEAQILHLLEMLGIREE